MFSFFKKQTREELIDKKVNEIMYLITNDHLCLFSHLEQSKILNEVILQYKSKKTKEHTNAVKLAEEIDKSINELK